MSFDAGDHDGPHAECERDAHDAAEEIASLRAQIAEATRPIMLAISDRAIHQTIANAIDMANRAKVEADDTRADLERALETAKNERALRREMEAARDRHRDALNRIANRLHVVHEDDKIEAAVAALERERDEARDEDGLRQILEMRPTEPISADIASRLLRGKRP